MIDRDHSKAKASVSNADCVPFTNSVRNQASLKNCPSGEVWKEYTANAMAAECARRPPSMQMFIPHRRALICSVPHHSAIPNRKHDPLQHSQVRRCVVFTFCPNDVWVDVTPRFPLAPVKLENIFCDPSEDWFEPWR